MKKSSCRKCRGIYYNDKETNKMISLQLDVYNKLANKSDEEISMMNPNLKSNYLTILYESKKYLDDKLGDEKFCSCQYDTIKKEEKSNMHSSEIRGRKIREFSDSEMNEIERKGQVMMLMQGIKEVINRYK